MDTFRPDSDVSRACTDSFRSSTHTSRVSTNASHASIGDFRTITGASRRPSEETVHQMILQSKLLEVVESLIVLEHALLSRFQALTPDHLGNSDFEMIMKGGDETTLVEASRMEVHASRFVQGKSLSSQEMLLNMVLCSLKSPSNFEMSSRWTGFVIDCLPYLGGDLKKWVVPVVKQMCCNLSDVSELFDVDSIKSWKRNDKR